MWPHHFHQWGQSPIDLKPFEKWQRKLDICISVSSLGPVIYPNGILHMKVVCRNYRRDDQGIIAVSYQFICPTARQGQHWKIEPVTNWGCALIIDIIFNLTDMQNLSDIICVCM